MLDSLPQETAQKTKKQNVAYFIASEITQGNEELKTGSPSVRKHANFQTELPWVSIRLNGQSIYCSLSRSPGRI